jgi:hypothetical protein
MRIAHRPSRNESQQSGERLPTDQDPGRWKGKLAERLAQLILTSRGFLVDRAEDTGTKRGELWISKTNDRFGCFDMLGVQVGQRDQYVQVTTHNGTAHRRAKIAHVQAYLDRATKDVQIWTSHSRREGNRVKVWFWVYHMDVAGKWWRDPDPIVAAPEQVREVS